MAERVWITALLGMGAWLDWRYRRIPGALPLILAATGLIAGMIGGTFPAGLSGLLPGTICFLLSAFGGFPLGAGDGLMLLGLGAWEGVSSVLIQFLAALFLIACWGLAGVWMKGKGLKTEYPFLPFLFLCYLGSLVL